MQPLSESIKVYQALPPIYSDNSFTPIPPHQKKSFHLIDRELYSRIIISLCCSLPQARQVLALWIWLEEIGFPTINARVLKLSKKVLHYVVDEAVLCINCIQTGTIPPSPFCDIPLTTNILESDISLEFFLHHKKIALEGITRIMQNIHGAVFQDIEQLSASTPEPVMDQYLNGLIIRPYGEGCSNRVAVDGRNTQMNYQRQVSIPQSRRNSFARPLNESSPEIERTMFFTFSRGYSFSEDELLEFLTGMFGDCIESISMEKVTGPGDKPIYAHVILKKASTVTLILEGKDKAKFFVNGKHIWARRWEMRGNKPY